MMGFELRLWIVFSQVSKYCLCVKGTEKWCSRDVIWYFISCAQPTPTPTFQEAQRASPVEHLGLFIFAFCLLLLDGHGKVPYATEAPCYGTVCHSSIWLVQHVGAHDSYIDRPWQSAQACSSFAQKRNRCSSTWLPWLLGKCWGRVWFIWCGERNIFLL